MRYFLLVFLGLSLAAQAVQTKSQGPSKVSPPADVEVTAPCTLDPEEAVKMPDFN